jgi:hypothetical protein
MSLRGLPLAILIVGTLLLAWAPRADTQASVFPFRIDWETGPTDGKWQHVCGHLYNDTPSATREVRLLVEGRDASGRVIDSRRASVNGYISPWGRTYFCSTAVAGAARYSITIVVVQWDGGER